MKELMQKALNALAPGKTAGSVSRASVDTKRTQVAHQSEAWGMSSEDALRVGTVARYK